MTLKEALDQLESLGSEKMREFNRKRGAGENQFGIKLGEIRAVANKIKEDHALALAYWTCRKFSIALKLKCLARHRKCNGP